MESVSFLRGGHEAGRRNSSVQGSSFFGAEVETRTGARVGAVALALLAGQQGAVAELGFQFAQTRLGAGGLIELANACHDRNYILLHRGGQVAESEIGLDDYAVPGELFVLAFINF